MKSVLHRWLIVCCALYLSGAHWMVLQVTAWTGMVVARAQTASVREAVGTTLDGEHPCELCRAIAKGQTEEQQHGQQSDLPWAKKMQEGKLVPLAEVRAPGAPVTGGMAWPEFVKEWAGRTEAPPTPPPLA